jgi:hypothetical protein
VDAFDFYIKKNIILLLLLTITVSTYFMNKILHYDNNEGNGKIAN